MPSPKRIGQIEFGLLSPKEIREMSVRKIIWADTYDDDGFPYPQGLMDLNLGVIDPGLRCKTCDQKASECPGHFGHIELAKPVIHVGYTRLIRKLLRVTCRACGRVLLSPEEIENFPHKNVIVRALGMKDTVKVDTRYETPKARDTILLCSDGLSGPVTDAQMLDIVDSSSDLPTATRRLIEAANQGGGPDNITCILARWVP